ncbi:MAG: hypothetical protein ABSE86_01065 [Bryobacteraceae bacterium]|jgi:hypothetical protein
MPGSERTSRTGADHEELEDDCPPACPIRRRFRRYGGLLVGTVIWWAGRPKARSENAITAKPTELYTQQVDEEVRVEFHYAFTNHTNTEYTLPSADSGALMRHVPNALSVEKLDGATWDTTIRIPPHQNVGIVFSVPYTLAEFSTSNERWRLW